MHPVTDWMTLLCNVIDEVWQRMLNTPSFVEKYDQNVFLTVYDAVHIAEMMLLSETEVLDIVSFLTETLYSYVKKYQDIT